MVGLYQLYILLIDTLIKPSKLVRVVMYAPIVIVWGAGDLITKFLMLSLTSASSDPLDSIYASGFALFAFVTFNMVVMVSGALVSRR